jgi:WD40 repeat protein
MRSDFAYDACLSHNSNDKSRVRKLAERLRDAGLRVWFDECVIKPGDDIYLAVEHGLEAARVQVLCLSPAALGSEWVKLERSTVLFRDPSNTGRRFFPLLLAECTLPDTLRRYKHVDFREEPQAALDELLSACRPESQLRPPAPIHEQQEEPTKTKPKPVKAQDEAQPLAVLEHRLTGHRDRVQSVAVSPDGTWAVSGSDDTTIKIWNLETGECRTTLAGHTDMVRSIAIMPDGKRIVSGSNDNSIRIWDVVDGRVVTDWQTGEDFVHSVVAMPDGRRVITAGARDGVMKIWDVASRRCMATLEGHIVRRGFG